MDQQKDLLAKEFASKSKTLQTEKRQKWANAISGLSFVLIGLALYIPNGKIRLLIIVLSLALGCGVQGYALIQNLKVLRYLAKSQRELLQLLKEMLDSDGK